MVSNETAAELIRAMNGITERPHFSVEAFVAHGRIFVTLGRDADTLNIRFTPEQQRQFLEMDGEAFIEINDKWGKAGWTKIQLDYITRELLQEALEAAWETSKTPMKMGGSTKKKNTKKKAAKKIAKKTATKKKTAKKAAKKATSKTARQKSSKR